MKVALVYDRINKIGGAERILLVLHEIFPQAPLYTSVYDLKKAPWTKEFEIHPSFLQFIKCLPHEILPNLMPRAFAGFDFKEFDVVISVSSAEAKYLNIDRNKTRHINYCLTPTRYLWSGYFSYLINPGFGRWGSLIKFFFVIFAPFMRMNDFEEAQKVDKFIAISKEVQTRIKKYYRRQAKLVLPPLSFVDKKERKDAAAIDIKEKYFLIVSRLVPYKQIDLAIRVFNEIGKPLVIVGAGTDEARLKKMAKDNIIFIRKVKDDRLTKIYYNCEALIYPGIEDLGLTALEAQLFRKPVLCNTSGGTKETIVIGKTGEVFNGEEQLKNIVLHFDKNKYQVQDFQNNLLRFSKEKFKRDFEKEIV